MKSLRDGLERSDDNQNDDGDQQQHGKFIEVAEIDMASHVASGTEIEHEAVAHAVVHHEQQHKAKFGVHPAGTHVVPGVETDEPDSKQNGDDRGGCADSVDQLALHDDETVPADLIFSHGVVHKQAGQIKDGGKPADNRHDMKRLDPQHTAPLP